MNWKTLGKWIVFLHFVLLAVVGASYIPQLWEQMTVKIVGWQGYVGAYFMMGMIFFVCGALFWCVWVMLFSEGDVGIIGFYGT